MRFMALLIFLLPILGMAATLRPGDVLLQPKKCYSCTLIEQHENSIYAHMGVIIKGGKNPTVAEALGTVRVLPLDKFLASGDLSRPVKILRLKSRPHLPLQEAIVPWLGAEYDHDFLWDNVDQHGRETLYCSELVTKLLNPFLAEKIPTKIMNYDNNHEAWSRYFRGQTPDGLPGNSPGDFEKSKLFKTLGTYQDQQWTWL